MKRIVERLERLEGALLLIGSMVVIGVVFVQVVMRNLLQVSFSWAEELARYLFVYLTWIGASAAIGGDKHIRITMLGDSFPKIKAHLDIISTLICLSLSAFLLINGCQLIVRLATTGQTSVALRLPMWTAYLAIPFGGCLMVVKYCYRLVAVDLRQLRQKEG